MNNLSFNLFLAHYAKKHHTTVAAMQQLLARLQQPISRDQQLFTAQDTSLLQHIGNFCDQNSPINHQLTKYFDNAQMTMLQQHYQNLIHQGINFEPYLNPYYRFEKIKDWRDNSENKRARRYQDSQDYQINPQLIAAIKWRECTANTPEGKAIWLYTKLCDILKYDEGYYYQEHRHHPNDDAANSLALVAQTTPQTPTTCYNFARIAVKLLNQIPDVHATILSSNEQNDHFYFGFYTNKISVDAEPCRDLNGYNDMARIKLGMPPQGLRTIYGYATVKKHLATTVGEYLVHHKKHLQNYIQKLNTLSKETDSPQIDLPRMLKVCRTNDIDGATLTQFLSDFNHHFDNAPLQIARAAIYDYPNITPQLLVRATTPHRINPINQIDLNTLNATTITPSNLHYLVDTYQMLYADPDHTIRPSISGYERE